MYIETPRALIALVFIVLTAPAFADDCATVNSAILNTGHTPHSLIPPHADRRSG